VGSIVHPGSKSNDRATAQRSVAGMATNEEDRHDREGNESEIPARKDHKGAKTEEAQRVKGTAAQQPTSATTDPARTCLRQP